MAVLYGGTSVCIILVYVMRYESRVLREVYGTGRKEITEDWTKYHDELQKL